MTTFFVYLLDLATNSVEDSFTTSAYSRAEAMAEARELGWPVRRTRATSRGA